MERRQRQYAQLRNQDPALYERCVEAATTIALNHNLTTQAAAEIEAKLVAASIGEL